MVLWQRMTEKLLAVQKRVGELQDRVEKLEKRSASVIEPGRSDEPTEHARCRWCGSRSPGLQVEQGDLWLACDCGMATPPVHTEAACWEIWERVMRERETCGDCKNYGRDDSGYYMCFVRALPVDSEMSCCRWEPKP